MDDIKKTLRTQSLLAQWIKNFTSNTTKSKSTRAFTESDFSARIATLEKHWSTFLDNHFEICFVTKEKADLPYFAEEVHDQTVEHYLTSLAWHQDKLAELKRANSPEIVSHPTSPPGFSIQGSLEAVKIPTFSGNKKEWHTYRDKFIALVYNDQTAMPIIKFQRLLNSLEGEPLELLREIQVLGSNFQTAWETICSRYDDKLVRFNTQMHALVNLPSSKKESASHLSTLLNVASTSPNIFRSLGRPVDTWDDIFVYYVESKLSPQTRLDWAKDREEAEPFAKYSELLKFLRTRIRTLQRVETDGGSVDVSSGSNPHNKLPSSSSGKGESRDKRHKSSSTLVAVSESRDIKPHVKCQFCNESHSIYRCTKFTALPVQERKSWVISHKLCFNCLAGGHRVDACPSSHRCNVCQGKHHSKLHVEKREGVPTNSQGKAQEPLATAAATINAATLTQSVKSSNFTSNAGKTKILTTAIVIIEAPSGATYQARALLDSCSEESYVTEHVAQALALPRRPACVAIKGLGDATAVSKHWVTFTLKSLSDSNFSQQVNALTLKRLTSVIPRTKVDINDWSYLDGLSLADPHCNTPGRIDCLLGAEIFANILLPGLTPGPIGSPTALSTVFGWILMGGTNQSSKDEVTDSTNFHVSIDHELSQALTKFWEVEEPKSVTCLSSKDELCYKHFRESVNRDDSGRFIVRLPFSHDVTFTGSREIATSSLHRMEKRFRRQPEVRESYISFMEEYSQLDHMQLVPETEVISHKAFYIPHHPVFKEGDHKKIRVVFNASQSSDNGMSLNNTLYSGPNLLSDIRIILILWRFYRFVFSCDIVKMFRQFLVHPADRDWQRILWRNSENKPVQTFKLNTVTYGTVCAPFLANACMLELASRERDSFPLGANSILHHRYADDFFVGTSSPEDLNLQADQLVKILASAGMSVGKWSSNSTDLLAKLNLPHLSSRDICQPDNISVQTLGLLWNPIDDYFHFKHCKIESQNTASKRNILSQIARLFDPLGYVSPFIIRAKILLQSLWLSGVDWDTPVSPLVQQTWNEFLSELPSIEKLRVPRWINFTPDESWDLHGFCDASERAYAATLFVVVRNSRGIFSSLLIAKSKVSPLKVLNIPRLELCAALLLAQLITFVNKDLIYKPSRIFCWTDSQIVLAWLKGHPSRWKTFTANRVSEIHTLLPSADWRHVRSRDNPADCATRGLSVSELTHFDLWWHGPSWLLSDPVDWPSTSNIICQTDLDLRKDALCFNLSNEDLSSWSVWLERFSSIHRLVRVLAYINRWKTNASLPANLRRKTWLSASEINQGYVLLWRLVQRACFADDLQFLHNHPNVSLSSRLRRLSPFIDVNGLLRVGGRLQNAALNEHERHPIILPAKHHASFLLVRDTHLQTLHGGPLLVQSVLHRQYWIIRGRNFIRSFTRRCVKCARFSGRTVQQQMGPLPAVRTRPARLFTYTGVDYAGPFWIKSSPGRGRAAFKGYVSIFVCLVTKATHIEVVSDYSSAAFIAAFKRFVSRRGLCKTIYSDHGTTFQGAESELKRLFSQVSATSQEIACLLAKDGVEWSYIPPNAPNFGGLWEATVKSFKTHFKRVVGDTLLTFEELSTLATQIEACLNSRPLSALNNNDEDVVALTPAHFLIGSVICSPPEPFQEVDQSLSLGSRWHLLTLMRNQFWSRWSKEYLSQLQQKSKWLRPQPNLAINDVVLIKNELQPPSKWLMGRIVKIFPGSDSLCRVASVKCAASTYKRPVNKLVRLPIEDSSQAPLLTSSS